VGAVGSLEAKPVEENYSIDIIRFIAIFMVILLHCTGFPYHFTNTSITNMDIVNWFSTNVYAAVGMFGVPLFVMLTGALLLNPNREDEPLKVFYKKRLDRIALPFIFWTVIYFAWTFTVLGKPLTLLSIMQGLSNGAFAHLWYLYLLMGLYAITPILRVLVKHLDRKLFAYLLVLWFVGTALTPAVHVFLPELNYHPYTFILLDWVGYFLSGAYLLEANMRRSRVYLIVLLGLVGTVVGDWLLTGTMGERYTGFFHSYVSPTVILGSAALFLALIALDLNRLRKYKVSNRLIHWVSQNTLPIYLIHMIVIVTLISTSVFGIWLNSLTHTPLIDAPAFAVVVFAVSSAIVFILKKIPYIKKLVG
jgi:surface polysaccharide O-acyltransferase-like enzyme